MQKLIIGCGFLGFRVAERWQQAGHDVTILTRSARRARELRSKGLAPIVGDVTVPDTLQRLDHSYDTVLYAVGYDRFAEPTKRVVYVDGLHNVLRQIAPRTSRFLYISSTSVYGTDDGSWVDETTICHPRTENGSICLDAEQVVGRFFAINPDRPANILRLSGLYGPGRLAARITKLRAGQPLPGNADGWVNLIHVEDAVQAVLACEARGTAGAVYLVSDDRPLRRREYYRTLASFVGAPEPRFEFHSDSTAQTDGLNKRCCNRRLRQELGMALAFPTLQDGLLRTSEF